MTNVHIKSSRCLLTCIIGLTDIMYDLKVSTDCGTGRWYYLISVLATGSAYKNTCINVFNLIFSLRYAQRNYRMPYTYM